MSKEDAWKLFDPYDNDVVIGDSMTVYEVEMLKMAFFAGYDAAQQMRAADVCPADGGKHSWLPNKDDYLIYSCCKCGARG